MHGGCQLLLGSVAACQYHLTHHLYKQPLKWQAPPASYKLSKG